MDEDEEFSLEFLREMRAIIQEERDLLARRQLTTHDEIQQVVDSDAGIHDTIDTTMLEETTSTLVRLKGRELERLKELNAALQRLDDETYGFCEETDEMIPAKRLRANPIARLSIHAQEDVEKKAKEWNFRRGMMDDME